MKLGSVQRNVLRLLQSQAPKGVYIGATTKAVELRGYDLSQVERALSGLIRRKIVYKKRNPGGSLELYYLSDIKESV